MPVLRKRAPVDNKGINGLYVHSNPPRILSISAAHIKQLIRNGDIEKLEQVVLEGQGKKLVGEYSADYKTRMFLKSVPTLMSKISLLHDSLNSDRLAELQSILDEEPERKKKLVMAKDESGVGLLHKAVYYDLKSIYRWLIDKFPHTVNLKDSEGRTPYFYTLMCKDPLAVQKLLTIAGADSHVQDYRQHTTKYYASHVQELELPSGPKSLAASRKSTASKESLNFKKSNIRIWIHQRNMANLQQVVWEGHGTKLLVEHSNNSKMRKFLEAVPYIMGLIKDVHCDVQNGDLDSLKHRISPPVPIAVLTAKDTNGLTPLHKAVGLGKDEIAKYIIEQVPSSVRAIDNEGRTPLHYAALLKDDNKIFNYLIEHGADESTLDNRQKTAAYYKTRASELDSKLLNVVPDCPRGAKEPTSFDWSMLTSAASALPLNGIIKKAAEKLENGVKETLGLHDSSRSKEEVEQNEINESPKGDPKTEVEDNIEINEVNGRLSNREEVDNHEKSIEGEGNDNGATEDNELNEKKSEEDQKSDTEEETHKSEKDEPNQEDETKNEAEIDEPEASKEPEQDEDQNNEHEASNNLEEEPKEEDKPEETTEEVSNNEDNHSVEPKDEENNNDPESKDPEVEPVTDQPEESAESPRTKPNSTQSTHQSRPASSASPRTRSSTGVIEGHEDYDSDKEEKPIIEHPEIEGEGVIEGVVNGEDEVEPINNEGQKRPETNEHDIKSMITSGNMEQLAAMVLNGDGEKLVGETSNNQELQTFLENVPVYMAKINRIHEAAREGVLRDLQAALDRRKFAVARDKISPNGATPLHVAVAFGRTSVVRYLAGRFPETVHVEDDNGRTPLHYAAMLRDNGHYYNLLIHLGADNRVKDKFEHTPEYYIKNQSEFNHRQILLDFGAEEEAEEILNEKEEPDDVWSARRNLDDEDMISVLDRCFAVLHGRRNSNTISAVSINTISSDSKNRRSSAIVSKQLKRYIYDSVKLKLTRSDHNLYDIIWPSVKKLPTQPSIRKALEEDFPLGIVAPDLHIYKVFEKCLNPIIKEYNYIDLHHEFAQHPQTEFLQNGNDLDLDLDPLGKFILTGTLECTRNLKDFELPKSLATSELETVERLITNILLSKQTARALYPNASDDEIKENGCGIYYTMNEVLEDPSEARVILASNSLLIPLWNIPESDRLHGKHWPYGRGVFVNNSCNLAVYVNVLDHIRIITCTAHSTPGTIGLIYSRVSRLMAILQDELEFAFDEKLGYLSSRPTVLGCGLRFNLTLKCPNLLKEPDNLRYLCLVRGLSYNRNPNAADIFKLGNSVTVGVSELQCFEDFTTAVANILQLEKDMSMTNSLHIAAMFVNIFKKKKSLSNQRDSK